MARLSDPPHIFGKDYGWSESAVIPRLIAIMKRSPYYYEHLSDDRAEEVRIFVKYRELIDEKSEQP